MQLPDGNLFDKLVDKYSEQEANAQVYRQQQDRQSNALTLHEAAVT